MTLTLVFFLSSFVRAEENKRLKLSTFSTTEGLINNNINVILQDNFGYIWIGTEDGLNRFNGHEFEQAEDIFESPLEQQYVRSLAHDQEQDELWIGTHSTLQSFNFKTKKLMRWVLKDKEGNEDIRCILIEPTGNIWVSLFDVGVYLKKPDDSQFHYQKSLPSRVYSMTQVGDQVWIGHEDGFHPIELIEGVHVFDMSHGLNGFQVNTLSFINESLWLGTQKQGVWSYNLKNKEMKHRYKTDNACLTVEEDHLGNIWLSAEGNGVIQLDKAFGYRAINRTNQVTTQNSIRCIYRDRQNFLWLAPYNEGVSVYNPFDPFINLTVKSGSHDGLSGKNITSVFSEDQGNLLVGCDGGGIDRYSLSDDRTENLVSGMNIMSMHKSNDTLWIGTYQKGLWRYLNNKLSQVKVLNQPKILDNENIWDVNQIDGVIWMATDNGVMNYNPRTKNISQFKNIKSDANSLSENECRIIYKDVKNDIWIGTFKGLNRYNKDSNNFDRFKLISGTEGDLTDAYGILSIAEDHNLNFWIGTFGRGLLRLDRNLGHVVKADSSWSIALNTIYSIEATQENKLWYSTNQGLAMTDPANGQVKLYGFEDGLQSVQYNYESSLTMSDGRMVFGGNRGLSLFDPTNVQNLQQELSDPIVSRIYIESGEGELRKQNLWYESELKIPPDERKFMFDFLSFDFGNKHKVEYQYKLEGFDHNWNTTTNRTSPLYSNLKPGKYTFQVRSRLQHTPWKYSSAIMLDLSPRFVETWFFKICIAIVGTIFLTLIFYLYMRRLKLQKDHLDKLVKSRSAELVEKERAMTEAELKNAEFVKETLMIREKELAAQAVRQIHLRNIVDQVSKQLEELQQDVTHTNKLKISRIIRDMQSNRALAKDWNLLDSMFAHVHKEFIENLHIRHPKLTSGNLRLCSLIRMNLSTKDVAAIMGISEDSVKMARKRLRKKLELETTINLQDYIMEL